MFLKSKSNKQRNVEKKRKEILHKLKQNYEQNKETKQKQTSHPPIKLFIMYIIKSLANRYL